MNMLNKIRGDAEAVAEFNMMQEYRRFAKTIADSFLQAID